MLTLGFVLLLVILALPLLAVTATITRNWSSGTDGLSGRRAVEGELEQRVSHTIPAGTAGTLTTRTDDNTGVITTTASHSFTTSDFVDVFWTGGIQRRCDITAVTGTTLTIDLGVGDNLPALSTAVVVSKPTQLAVSVDVSEVKGVFIGSNKRVYYKTNSDASPGNNGEIPANDCVLWGYGDTAANPLTTDVTALFVSNGEAAAASFEFRIIADATP